MNPPSARVARLKAALAEVLAQRQSFTDEAYNEIILALNDKIHALQPLVRDTQPQVAESDEIRLVSVMFVDVENSTRLARYLDEQWKTMIGEVHARLARVVEEWDGEIGQYLGDGVLCFFGAHHSRADDAVRAVSCALAIQKMAQEFAPQVRARYGQEFALRVGISSGRVVVGVIGTAAKSEFVAMGPTTNLAARLQNLCPSKQVLIDATTFQRVRERFVVQPQEPVRLKGFDTPVESFLVTGRRRHRSELLTGDQIGGLTLPFVGRALELNMLLGLLDDAVRDREFHVITIFGETGVGKSRLLQEALAAIIDRPFHVVSMVARYEKRTTTHNLLADLVTDLCELTEGAAPFVSEARIIRCISDLLSGAEREIVPVVIGRMIGFEFTDYPAYEMTALDAVIRWLRALAGQRTLLMAVDNLQWADAASVELLENLAIALVDQWGVLVATARTEFGEIYPEFMATCARYTDMNLGRLSDFATQEMIRSVVQYVDNAPTLLSEHICQRSDGNPLFVEEFLRMLFDSGVFEPDGTGRWRANRYLYGTLSSALPNGLMGVFQARLDDLPNVTRRAMQLASVIGLTFWEAAITHLSGFDTGPMLEDLTARGILIAQTESTIENQIEYRFRHTLYREVAYAMLTRSDREIYHQRAAEWLAAHVMDRPDYLGILAEHLVQGNKREQALAIYLAAADDRLRRGLAGETLKLIESGLASARDVPREIALPLVSQLWMLQGQALLALKRYDEASAAAQSALRLMNELPADDYVEERLQASQVLELANVARLESDGNPA